jgi:hypothetical protein
MAAENGQQASQVGASVFEDDGEAPGDTAAASSRAAKYPCLRCKKNVGRNSVKCRCCQLWVHAECGNISKELFSILANPTKYGAGVSWSCDSCQASAARLDARMNALETRFQEVENRVVRSEGVVQEATRRVDKVEDRQSKLEKDMEREREMIREEIAAEMREREIRKKNVIMHRVGEAGPEVKTLEDRKAWDMKSCNNIFRALDLDMSSDSAVRFVRRVGERGEGPRPLVVGLKKEWQREDLLERARQLKDTQFAEVTIVPDLTEGQRNEEAAMNSEVEKRNSELTEEDKAKNLEWRVVVARGEKRVVKGQARPRGAASMADGSARGRPAARGRGAALLPPRLRQGPWDPAARGRGATRGRPRANSKRTRTDRREQDEYEEEDEEEMEDERQAPPQPPPPPPQAAEMN